MEQTILSVLTRRTLYPAEHEAMRIRKSPGYVRFLNGLDKLQGDLPPF